MCSLMSASGSDANGSKSEPVHMLDHMTPNGDLQVPDPSEFNHDEARIRSLSLNFIYREDPRGPQPEDTNSKIQSRVTE